MPTVEDICSAMQSIAPLELAAEWDNVGLLLGESAQSVTRLMTTLTLSTTTVQEAIDRSASMVIAHHPLPFRPLKTITDASYYGGLVWKLASRSIAVYSPHTAWDSAKAGINQQLAELLGLQAIAPLEPTSIEGLEGCGTGRFGVVREDVHLAGFCEQVAAGIPDARTRTVDAGKKIRKVAIACGSGGSFLSAARRAGCDTLLTGEATYHDCLEAQAAGVNLVLVGHHASERFSLEVLARRLSGQFSDVECWASANEFDPVQAVRSASTS